MRKIYDQKMINLSYITSSYAKNKNGTNVSIEFNNFTTSNGQAMIMGRIKNIDDK